MKLYYSPLSLYSIKVLSALLEKNISVPFELVDLLNPQTKLQFESKYVFGKVPLLETDEGGLLPESSIIVEFFEGYGPDLIPKDPTLALRARLMDRMLDLYLAEPLSALMLERFKDKSLQDLSKVSLLHKKINRGLSWLNDQIKGPWMVGEEFSLADCSALGPLYFVQNETELSEWPKLQVYALRLIQRSSSRKLLDEVIQALNVFKPK